jgi:hypothetical protein
VLLYTAPKITTNPEGRDVSSKSYIVTKIKLQKEVKPQIMILPVNRLSMPERQNMTNLQYFGVLFTIAIMILILGPYITGSSKPKSVITNTQKYEFQNFYQTYSPNSLRYKFIMVEDLDKESKSGTYQWKSKLIFGELTRDPVTGKYSFSLSNEVKYLIQSKEIQKLNMN